MYCITCGKQIDDRAIMCPGCGVPTVNYQQPQSQQQWAPPPQQPIQQPQPVIINNTVSSKSTAVVKGARRRHSLLFDLFMIVITGGLWIIWMIFRPKYY